jgi:L-fuconolactonase
MRIDAHQHFWTYDPIPYNWIQTDVLKQDYLPADLKPQLEAAGFEGTVAVQARSTWQDAYWLLDLADEHPWIVGVVGWADLAAPDLSARLARLTPHPKFRGIRGSILTESLASEAPRADFLQGLRVLTASNLTFDLLIHPAQLPLACRVVEAVPDQRFVLDHLANPLIAEGAMEPWATDLRRLASYPNVACKVSGMVTRADHADWEVSDFAPYLDTVFAAFGPDRLLVGSDWPVCRQAAEYEVTMGIVSNYVDRLSEAEQAAVLGGSAARWYALTVRSHTERCAPSFIQGNIAISMASPKVNLVPEVTLGRTGLVSSRIGLGTAAWPHEVPYAQTLEMVRTAFDAGIRYIDTAPLYHTEEIVGRALQDLDLVGEVVIATKAGSYSDREIGAYYTAYRAGQIRRSVERSLKRLGRNVLDIVHIHDVQTKDLDAVFGPGGALEGLMALRDEGLIRAIGMGALSLDCLRAAVDSGEVDVIQIFHTYTLLNQSATESLFSAATAKDVSILNSAPYAGYILATGAVPNARYNYAPASEAVIEATRRIEAVCAAKGVDLPTVALAFSLRNPDIDVTIPASGKPKRIQQWIDALSLPLTSEDWEEILAAAGGQHPMYH